MKGIYIIIYPVRRTQFILLILSFFFKLSHRSPSLLFVGKTILLPMQLFPTGRIMKRTTRIDIV